MSCKPGDLAIVVGKSKYAGKLVEVLRAAPPYEFTLPDGYPHLGEQPGVWVVKILGRKCRAPVHPKGWRMAQYGCAQDSKLRPLRGEPEKEDVEESLTA